MGESDGDGRRRDRLPRLAAGDGARGASAIHGGGLLHPPPPPAYVARSLRDSSPESPRVFPPHRRARVSAPLGNGLAQPRCREHAPQRGGVPRAAARREREAGGAGDEPREAIADSRLRPAFWLELCLGRRFPTVARADCTAPLRRSFPKIRVVMRSSPPR